MHVCPTEWVNFNYFNIMRVVYKHKLMILKNKQHIDYFQEIYRKTNQNIYCYVVCKNKGSDIRLTNSSIAIVIFDV